MALSGNLAFEIYYIELWHIISVLLIITVNFYIYLNARKNSLLYSYLIVEALLLIWMVSKIFKTVSPNPDIRWLFIVTQYFGNCFLGSAFFTFAYNYAKGKLPSKKVIILTSIPSLFFFISMATNPWHMLFYSYYDYSRDSFGPLFYLNQVYTYSLLLVGIILSGRQLFIDLHYKRMQAIIISLAVLIPLLVNIFYIMKFFKLLFGFRPLFDITPITCNISLLLFVVGTFKYRFFDIRVIAWRKVLNQIPEGIILFNKDRIITDINHIAANTPEIEEIQKTLSKYFSQDKTTDFIYTTTTGKHFNASLIPLTRKHNKDGYILRFIDDTAYQQTLQTLSYKNQVLKNLNGILSTKASTKQALAVYKTRNFIGGEVHDVLGHSIILALSVLEVSKISLKNDISAAKDKLDQAISIIKNGQYQMENTLIHSSSTSVTSKSNLITEIKRLVHETSLTGQSINLTIQGDSCEVPAHISEAVFRLCREAITNAIRHGNAENIAIIFRFYRAKLDIYIIDNGTGCSKIKIGYGLTCMEERIVKGLGGVLNYGSLEGGFTVGASIPVPLALV
jgi:signal transduction histidine kinase